MLFILVWSIYFDPFHSKKLCSMIICIINITLINLSSLLAQLELKADLKKQKTKHTLNATFILMRIKKYSFSIKFISKEI